jgi:hypothetical protein
MDSLGSDVSMGWALEVVIVGVLEFIRGECVSFVISGVRREWLEIELKWYFNTNLIYKNA